MISRALYDQMIAKAEESFAFLGGKVSLRIHDSCRKVAMRETVGNSRHTTILPLGFFESDENEIFKKEFPFLHWLDAPLRVAGVKMSAVVKKSYFGGINNRIVFEKGGKKSYVPCVHTIIYTATLSELPPDAELAQISTEMRPVKLPVEEHFFALSSYVQVIAEFGLMWCLTHQSQVKFGFNYMLSQQILRAIRSITPEGFIGNVYANAVFTQLDEGEAVTLHSGLTVTKTGETYKYENRSEEVTEEQARGDMRLFPQATN